MQTYGFSQGRHDAATTFAMEMLLHDLAAPLRHIDFFAQELRDSLVAPSADQLHHFQRLTHTLGAAHSLLEDGRLLLSAIRRPSLEGLEGAPLNSWLLEVVDSLRQDAEGKGLTLAVELGEDALVRGDPRSLGRVVSNLMNNALHATPAGGSIVLSSRRHLDSMVFSVSDSGKGFSREEAEILQHRLVDFDEGREPVGIWGGLGLLVCHTTLRRHGSRLLLTSEGHGKGATFSFAIPIVAVQDALRRGVHRDWESGSE